MEFAGHVSEIWRYPVKSMGGESLDKGLLTPSGLIGDRLWSVLDEDGEVKSARQWPRLIELAARFAADPIGRVYGDDVPDVNITTPNGATAQSRTAKLGELLEDLLGKKCRLEPLHPPSATEFYTLPKARDLSNLGVELDQLEGEELDFSQTPDEMMELLGTYMTPPGTYFDSFPLHLLSVQAMHHLANRSETDVDVRRFRPNLLIDFERSTAAVPEFDLIGKTVHIGDVVIRPQGKTFRCSIPSRAQPVLGLEHDPNMTRALVKQMERHFGIYSTIDVPGQVKVGDPVHIR